MAFSNAGNGGNPRFGRDSAGAYPPGAWNTTTAGGSALHTPYRVYFPTPYPSFVPPTTSVGAIPQPIPVVNNAALAAVNPAMQGPRQGAQAPLDPNFRTYNMRNSTGGFGCEPGYNYFFPAEHTKIHVLKTGSTPPWQLPANFTLQFHACHVPVNTTVAELMRGFGARNPNPKKNVITEVCNGGGGKWYKGITVAGDNADMMKLPIKELGWDATRTGLKGEKKVVYIYVEKD
ncbi:hypothetical protein SPI_02170 [Niveomyces insectorum RCEF 264]|uniref:Uncharacterized protein n=1 Tax=Niveomyces insectorum RCEF 264 TaxID=1081102 RepID=A0A167XTK2_9HYPO|nr:hypothetical protein SPI_02170 [Niveomyces insectorum RCEF 264]